MNDPDINKWIDYQVDHPGGGGKKGRVAPLFFCEREGAGIMFKGDEEAFCAAERGSIDTQTAAPSPFILSLPVIDQDVPMCYTQAAHPSIILLAKQLANIGVLTKDDTGKGRRRIDEAVKRVFSREISSILGELHLLTVSVDIGDGMPRDFFEPTPDHDATVMERFAFEVGFYDLPFLVIGKVLADLEQIRKGLGETVFAALSKAGSDNFGIFSFDSVLEERGWMYYLDEREWEEKQKAKKAKKGPSRKPAVALDDDEDEEYGDNVDDSEDDPYDGAPTRAELLEGAGFTWANKPQLRLTPKQIQRFIKDSATPAWAREILSATLEVAELYPSGSKGLGRFDYEVEPVYPIAVVRFNEEDQVMRMYDDYIQDCSDNQDHHTDMAHVEIVDLRDTANFKQWWEGVVAGFRMVKAMDRLLFALTCQSN